MVSVFIQTVQWILSFTWYLIEGIVTISKSKSLKWTYPISQAEEEPSLSQRYRREIQQWENLQLFRVYQIDIIPLLHNLNNKTKPQNRKMITGRALRKLKKSSKEPMSHVWICMWSWDSSKFKLSSFSWSHVFPWDGSLFSALKSWDSSIWAQVGLSQDLRAGKVSHLRKKARDQ